jgi:hypothetical protein
MAITFPSSPSNGQVFTVGNRSWTWDGNSWKGGVSSTGDASTLDGFDSTDFIRNNQSSDVALTGGLSVGNRMSVGLTDAESLPYYSNKLVLEVSSQDGITIAANDTSATNYLMFADSSSGDARFRGYIEYNHNNENLAIAQAAIHRLNFNNTEAVFNEAGNSYDFRVESDTVTHALYVKGSNGNVGIGELAPDEKLHIKNSTGSYIKHEGPSSGDYATGYQIFEGSTTSAAFYTNPTHDLTILSKDGITFRLDNANRIKFTSTGNVGIGITNPSAMLEFGGNTTDNRYDIKSPADNARGIGLGNYTTFSTRYSNWDTLIGTNIRSKIGTSSSGEETASGYTASGGAILRIGFQDLEFKNYSPTELSGLAAGSDVNSLGTTRFKIDADGNVGIGTNSPQRKLHIVNNGAMLRINRADGVDATWEFYSWSSGLNIYPVDGASTVWFGRDGQNTDVSLYNGRLAVNHTGAPPSGYAIYANGSIWAKSGAGDSGGLRLHSNSGINVSGNVMSFHTGQTNGFSFNGNSDGADGSNPLVVIKGDGKFGIGTTTPDNTLTVNGGTESIGVQISETARLTLGADGTWNYFKGKSGNGHYFNTTGGGLAVLNNAGNFGIGTSSPGYKLDVQGNFRSTGSIDGSNYAGYFMWKGNGTSYDVNNRTTKVPYGTAVYSGYNAGANRPTTYDIALQVSASGRAMEFSADWVSSTAGPLYFRTLRDCCINWSSWSSISMSTVSDRRVKDNIVNYTSSEARTLIEQLQAVEYDYVNHDGTKGNVDLEDPDADLIARPREVGYIAQDVEDVIPYAVDFNPKGDTPNENGWASAYTVNYERLVPVLTEALKDVYSKLDSLQTQLDSANQEIQRLRDG